MGENNKEMFGKIQPSPFPMREITVTEEQSEKIKTEISDLLKKSLKESGFNDEQIGKLDQEAINEINSLKFEEGVLKEPIRPKSTLALNRVMINQYRKLFGRLGGHDIIITSLDDSQNNYSEFSGEIDGVEMAVDSAKVENLFKKYMSIRNAVGMVKQKISSSKEKELVEWRERLFDELPLADSGK